MTGRLRVRCPTCGREIDWEQSPFKPFCSDRCRLIDLGAWLSEQHAIPGEAAPQDPEAPEGRRREPPGRGSP